MLVLITVQLRKAEQLAKMVSKKRQAGLQATLDTLQSSRNQLGKALDSIDRCLAILNQESKD